MCHTVRKLTLDIHFQATWKMLGSFWPDQAEIITKVLQFQIMYMNSHFSGLTICCYYLWLKNQFIELDFSIIERTKGRPSHIQGVGGLEDPLTKNYFTSKRHANMFLYILWNGVCTRSLPIGVSTFFATFEEELIPKIFQEPRITNGCLLII